MKGPVKAESGTGFGDLTPECHACGEEHVGMGEPIFLVIPGMLFPSMEYDVTMFVPDPDAKIRVVSMPNGQLAFVTDEKLIKHIHEECLEKLVEEVAYGSLDGPESENEDEPEEID